MENVKYVKDPGKFLNETGLIFEINRQILNPFGLALIISLEDEVGFSAGEFKIVDAREDKEGVVYDTESFMAGMLKVNEFMESFGLAKIEQRQEELGYVVQEHPDPFLKSNGVILVTYNPDFNEEDKQSPDTVVFRVPFDWLEKKTLEWFEWGVDVFLTEYTFDQSETIYDLAKRENVLIEQALTFDGYEGDGQ